MKILKVRWRNHHILSNLELDFTNSSNGQPFNTILFAGENGTGKTTILDTLSNFLNIGSFEPFDYIEYSINDQIYRAIPQTGEQNQTFFDIQYSDGTTKGIRTDKHNSKHLIEADNIDIRHYGCVFSKARADYKTEQIKYTTTKKLDLDKYDVDDNDDFTSLKQLIVDIENQDNSDFAGANKNPATVVDWPTFYSTSKIYRFKNAFDSFFEKVKYANVTDSDSEKAIIFEKNGKQISIDQLSTGEKQIVFRGTYLLKNSKKLEGAIVMIDEPELSMHPKWQRKILKYYKDLFTDSGIQTAQMFVASHSEHVLEESLADKVDNLVIVLTETTGIIEAKRIDAPAVLPTITAAETNYLAFDIVSNDYHIELYGYLQNKESISSVKGCDTFIAGSTNYIAGTHYKPSSHGTITYDTICTFIRNAIDHPDPTRTFTEAELRISIELLIEFCR